MISLILLLTGCNEQFSEGDVDLDSDFFPLKIGQFRLITGGKTSFKYFQEQIPSMGH